MTSSQRATGCAAILAIVLIGGREAGAAASLEARPNPACSRNGMPGSTKIFWDTDTKNQVGRLMKKRKKGPYEFVVEGTGKGNVPQNGLAPGIWIYRLYKANGVDTWTPPLTVRVDESGCLDVVGESDVPTRTAVAPAAPGAMKKLLEIQSVSLQPHGTYLDFTATSNTPAEWRFFASQPPFPPAKKCDMQLQTYDIGAPKTEWSGRVRKLKPDTRYFTRACARNADNDWVYRDRSIQTLRRKVTVRYGRIHVLDDSDSGVAAKGDLLFRFYAHNQGPKTHEATVGTGENTFPDKTFTIPDAPTSIQLHVVAWDDDTNWLFGKEFCDPEKPPCQDDWGEVKETFDLTFPEANSPPSDTAEEPFEYTATSHGDLAFKVHGTVKVEYVP